MTFVNDILSFETSVVDRMRAAFDNARAEAGKRRMYNRTLAELSALSDRELDDLGIHRSMISDIASDAAYGK